MTVTKNTYLQLAFASTLIFLLSHSSYSQLPFPVFQEEMGGDISIVALHPNGKLAAVSNGINFQIWDLNSSAILTSTNAVFENTAYRVTEMHFDGQDKIYVIVKPVYPNHTTQRKAVVHSEGMMQIYNYREGRLLNAIKQSSIAIDTTGKIFAPMTGSDASLMKFDEAQKLIAEVYNNTQVYLFFPF